MSAQHRRPRTHCGAVRFVAGVVVGLIFGAAGMAVAAPAANDQVLCAPGQYLRIDPGPVARCATDPAPSATQTPVPSASTTVVPSASVAPTATTTPATTPPVTPTPSPTPTGPTSRVCASFPAMPDASCTGVPPGVTLRSCPTTITAPGIYDSCLFSGDLFVNARNVTVTRSRVFGRVTGPAIAWAPSVVTIYDPTRNLQLIDVEVDGSTVNDPYGQAGIGQDGWSCLRCNVHHTGRGASIGSSVTIRDSYFHDFKGVDGAHMSAAGSNGGGNNVVVHNHFDCVSVTGKGVCSGAFVMYGDNSVITNWLIQNNLFASPGSYCVYAGSLSAKPFPHATRLTIVDNRWSRKYYQTCGQYGPVTGWELNTGSSWSGNAYTDGAAILV